MYLQNRKEKERQTEKEIVFKNIMHLLTEKLSLEESIEMFQNVEEDFYNICREELAEISKNKNILEKFLF